MINISYRFMYNNGSSGFFEGVQSKASLKHIKLMLDNLGTYNCVAVVFYCGNKPVLLKWNKKEMKQ